jgi:hypothetical protein
MPYVDQAELRKRIWTSDGHATPAAIRAFNKGSKALRTFVGPFGSAGLQAINYHIIQCATCANKVLEAKRARSKSSVFEGNKEDKAVE